MDFGVRTRVGGLGDTEFLEEGYLSRWAGRAWEVVILLVTAKSRVCAHGSGWLRLD